MQAFGVENTQKPLTSVTSVDASETFYATKSSFFEKFRKVGIAILGFAICAVVVLAFVGFATTNYQVAEIDTDVPNAAAIDAWVALNKEVPTNNYIEDGDLTMDLAAAPKRVTHVRKVVLNSGIVNDLFGQFNRKQISFFVLKPDATAPERLTHIVKGGPGASFQDFKSKFLNTQSSIGLFNFKAGSIEIPIVVIISPNLSPDTVSNLYFFPDMPNKIPVPNVRIFVGQNTNTLFKENFLVYSRDARLNGTPINSYYIAKSQPNNANINPITYTEAFNLFRTNRVSFLIFTYVDVNNIIVTLPPPNVPFNVFVDQFDNSKIQLAFVNVNAGGSTKLVALASTFSIKTPQLLPMFNLPQTQAGLSSTYSLYNVYVAHAQTKSAVTLPLLQNTIERLN